MTAVESRPHLNGVDTETLFATIGVVAGQLDLAQFQFRVANEWVNCTHSRSTIDTFYGAGQEQSHVRRFQFDADHPTSLGGADNGPTPVEFLLHGLASCLTAGIANIAAARKVELRSVRSTLKGDMDFQGILGLSDEVRNGYQSIRVNFEIDADASVEKIEAIVEQSRARSAVFDVITNGVPVTICVDAKSTSTTS